ncbi:MAG: hypothetical protein WC559_06160 [Candidatus Omnitrophota bacterium]
MRKKRSSKSSWRLLIAFGAITAILVGLTAPAMAQTVAIKATCSIPAIPGVNSPMLESQSATTADKTKDSAQYTSDNIEAAAKEKIPTIMQEEASRSSSTAIAPNVSTPMVTRTLYSR